MRVNAFLMKRVNPEGLTWPEWAQAAGVRYKGKDFPFCPCSDCLNGRTTHLAGFGFERVISRVYKRESKAWRAGEDPSEWRRESTNQRHWK